MPVGVVLVLVIVAVAALAGGYGGHRLLSTLTPPPAPAIGLLAAGILGAAAVTAALELYFLVDGLDAVDGEGFQADRHVVSVHLRELALHAGTLTALGALTGLLGSRVARS